MRAARSLVPRPDRRRRSPSVGRRVVAGLIAVALITAACDGSDTGAPAAGPAADSNSDEPMEDTMPSDPTNSSEPVTPRPDPTREDGAEESIDDGAACSPPAGNTPWYDSIVAFEHHDSGRTHTFPCATFSGSIDGPNVVEAMVSPIAYPTVYNAVHLEPGEAFLYGGGYGDNPNAEGHFVARVDPVTLDETWRTELFDAASRPDVWVYPGVIAALDDGFVYAIHGTNFTRLDPATGAVLAQLELPTEGDRADAAYNGFTGLTDGSIVAKTVHRQAGCTEQGFPAFLRCPDPLAVPASTIVVIDPATMTVLDTTVADEFLGGRITATARNGRDYVYLTGSSTAFRYEWDGKNLRLDDTWTPPPFLLDGQTTASAVAVLGDHVVFQTNAVPSTTPMSVVAIDQDDATLTRLEPFAGEDAAFSWLPAKLSVDPDNGIAYAMDGAVGKAGAWRIDPTTGTFEELWIVDQVTMNFSTLVGPADERVFIATDFAGVDPDLVDRNPLALALATGEQVVFRNAATGEELARSGTLPRMSTGALVTPAPGGDVLYFGLDGDVVRLHVEPAAD